MEVENDVVCTSCGNIDVDVMCSRGDREDGWKLTTPICSVCGGDTRVSFAHGVPPIYKAFAPRVMTDKLTITSRAEEEMLVAKIKERHPGVREVHFESDSPRQRKQRADEARHMAWSERMVRGIGEDAPKAQSELVEAVRASAAKEALKDNIDPKAAGDAAAAAIPSAAELAGAVR